MGEKYITEALSGYNTSPPVDDGSQTEANKVKYSTTKSKLADPIKDQVANIDAKLLAMADLGPDAKLTTYTTVSGDHQKTVECDGTFTVTLLAVATAPAGYTSTIKNIGTGVITVDASGTETIDGATSTIALSGQSSISVQLNQAKTGYSILVAPISSFGRTLIDDADAAAARSTLGVGLGTGDLVSTNNLSDVTDAPTALINLGGASLAANNTFAGDSTFSTTITGNITGNAGSITNQGNLATLNSVGAAQIDADAVGSSEIAAGAVGSSEIAADAVGSSEIAANSVGDSERIQTIASSGSISLAADGSWTPSVGLYNVQAGSSVVLSLYVGGAWQTAASNASGLVFFDGTNMRITDLGSASSTIYYQKMS